jgi:AAHS family 4-hydroxybenzoate transporter-like MFS transporter
MDAVATIDQTPISKFQYRTIITCFVVSLLDGFNMYALPYTAPHLLHEFHLSRAVLGTLVSAGLLGAVFSGLIGGMLADKFGRRYVILASVLIFSTTTVLKGFSDSYNMLLALQILSGLGLGGAYMNGMALAAEYAPARVRRFTVTCVSSGFPLGGILAGYTTAIMEPVFGWRSVFYLGGGTALAALVISWVILPDSVRQLILMRRAPAKIQAIMQAIGGGAPGQVWTSTENRLEGSPLTELFTRGRAVITTLLAIAMLVSLMTGYFITSWSPTLLNGAGISLGKALIASTMGQAGSVIGSLIWGRLIDRIWPPAVFSFAAVIAGICYSLIGHSTFYYPLLLAVFFVGGLGTGVTPAYDGFITSLYPTSMRGTALGFIIGVGRVGAIMGPLIGSALMVANWDMVHLYYVPALALIAVLLCMAALSIFENPKSIVVLSRIRPV